MLIAASHILTILHSAAADSVVIVSAALTIFDETCNTPAMRGQKVA